MIEPKTLTLDFIWQRRLKLWAEVNKLLAEGDKLRAEGNKLRAEGNKLWEEAILEVYGDIKLQWLRRADIPDELFAAFDKQRVSRNQVKKGSLAAAVRLWLALPEDIQAKLLSHSLDEKALSAGLILFSKLSDSEQKKAIYEALAEDIVDSAKAEENEFACEWAWRLFKLD